MTSAPIQPQDLVLYVMPGCGFCHDVQRAARSMGVALETVDVRADPRHAAVLVAARGRRTVPVLRISTPGAPERFMGESRDIIRYLATRYGPSTAIPHHSGGGTTASAVLVAMFVVLTWLLLGGPNGLQLVRGALAH